VPRLYLSPPDVGPEERALLLDAFDSNWITPLGPHVTAFEEELAAFTGAEACAALQSGTAALHLALLLAGVGQGDEVIVPSLTFIAPASACRYVGASLRFVDSERATWNLDPELLDEALSSGRPPAAVIAVDLYGQCAQLDRIAEVCERHGVPLIEDAAEAIGATWRDRHAGTWARYGAYSFNGNKIITTGGGGALVGPPEDMERARYLASQARQPTMHYEHTEIGFNYRLSNLLAAVGRGQLASLPGKIDALHRINQRYRDGLRDVAGLSFMPWDRRGRTNGWLTVIQLDPEAVSVAPAQLCKELDQQDIEARPAWKPMHLQPVFAEAPRVGGAVASELFERGVCLPSGSSMGDADVDRVVSSIREAIGA
jgi:pyridoxal phosphate-dependent aminotransferase EpsN